MHIRAPSFSKIWRRCANGHRAAAAKRKLDFSFILFTIKRMPRRYSDHVATSGGSSASANTGGGPVDSCSIRTSGAGVVRLMAARDNGSICSVSLFIYRF